MDRTLLRLLCTASCLTIACSSDELVLPSEGDPSVIEVLAGNGQNGLVGGQLPESLVVRVTDLQDRPVQGQSVVFVMTGDSTGQLLPDTVVTDASGRAASRWQLGIAAGVQQVVARVIGATLPLTATFSATADPAPPSILALVSGNNQAGQVGDLLPESLEVALTDEYGNPIIGADVQWTAQHGSVSSGVSTTGSNGRAAVQWTLGLLPGTQHVNAAFAGVNGSPVLFTASATVGPPPRLVIYTQPSATVTSGEVFPQQPMLQVEDNLGNPILQGGISVTVSISSGGGTLGGTTTRTTNASGQVQFTDLSITGKAGPRTLIFAAPGHTTASSRPIDVTSSAPSPSLSTVAVAPGTIGASTGASSATITVTVRDDANNPIAGAIVVFSASGTGNKLTQPGLTDANGVATGLLSSTISEVKTITATAQNVTLSQTASVTVNPGPLDPAASTAVVPAGKIFQPTRIVVTGRDQWGNRVTVGGAQMVMDVSGANRRNKVKGTDNGDGTYSVSYVPFSLGNDFIAITLDHVAIAGSPYTSPVGF
jgi:adhesin/invasin